MRNSNYFKPTTFIKDLPGIESLKSGFSEAFDSFLYEWAESWLPYYQEFIRRDADVFEGVNATTCGYDWAECYDRNGSYYRFSETPLWGKTLSLNAGAGYTDLCWRSCFGRKYPQFNLTIIEHYREEMFLNWYFHRYYKKDPKYNVVTDRLRDYFRQLTGDPDIIFDVGWKTFIYRDPRKVDILNSFPSFYY